MDFVVSFVFLVIFVFQKMSLRLARSLLVDEGIVGAEGWAVKNAEALRPQYKLVRRYSARSLASMRSYSLPSTRKYCGPTM